MASISSMITDPIRRIGKGGLFAVRVLASVRPGHRLLSSTLHQIYFIGVRSLVIIMTCGFFVGMVLALQGYDTLTTFGATDAVGTVLALSLYRELGPVLAALLFAGRAGTAIAAEIGLMRATEQITAMDLMALDPVERVVLPRFLAGVISLPLLTGIFNAMAILGGVLFAVGLMGMDGGIFWSNMQQNVEFYADFVSGLIKSVGFGAIATLVAVYSGYHATPTGEGVSKATTQTVVISAILILVLDYVLTSIWV